MLLIWIGQQTSVLTVLLLILGSGMLGSTLMRWQGWRVWRGMEAQVRRGEDPQIQALDGALIFLGGVLLIIPGVLSDVVGLTLMIPLARVLLRHRLAQWLKRRAVFQAQSNGSFTASWSVQSGSEPVPPRDPNIIDAEFERLPDEPRRLEG